MTIGIALGIPIGVGMGNIAIGPALGVAIGVAIGTAWEKKHEKELRPLTKKEEALKRRTILLSIGTLILGLIAFFAIYLFSK